MKAILALLCVTLASAAEFSDEWNSWKELYQKTYECEHEELARYTTWVANKAYIEEHNKNAEAHGYTLKMNEFGDMVSHSQFYTYIPTSSICFRSQLSLHECTMVIATQRANKMEKSIIVQARISLLL